MRAARSWLVRPLQLAILAGAAGAWEFGARRGWIDPFFFSRPSLFVARAWSWVADPAGAQLGGRSVFRHLAVTLEEMLGGFFLGWLFA